MYKKVNHSLSVLINGSHQTQRQIKKYYPHSFTSAFMTAAVFSMNPSSRIFSNDWNQHYRSEKPLPPINNDDSVFDDAEEDDSPVTISTSDAALRFSSTDSTSAPLPERNGSAVLNSTSSSEWLLHQLPPPLRQQQWSFQDVSNSYGLLSRAGTAEELLRSRLHFASPVAAVTTIAESMAPRQLPSPQPQVVVESDIRDSDVLCGRGGKSNHHPGNKRYRQVIGDLRRKYRGTSAKVAKTNLSRAIVDYVNAYGGRFLKMDKAGWVVLTKGEARKKTAQALRETKELKWTEQKTNVNM